MVAAAPPRIARMPRSPLPVLTLGAAAPAHAVRFMGRSLRTESLPSLTASSKLTSTKCP
jgi:hypothetical protein